jgi:hypothetical protein
MSTPLNLDGIRVQTARMLEIYALLRRELDGGNRLGASPEDRGRLQRAVDTIAANMADLATRLSAAAEQCSPPDEEGRVDYPGIGRLDRSEARELEEILDAVLRWHAEILQNDTGE